MNKKLEFVEGCLIGYRVWSIRLQQKTGNYAVCPWADFIFNQEGFSTWPLEPTPAKDAFPFPQNNLVNSLVDSCNNIGYHAVRRRPLETEVGLILRFQVLRFQVLRYPNDSGYRGPLVGRVEMWGLVTEGEFGYRAEYMRPTHLVMAEHLPAEQKQAALQFAEAWGARIVESVEELP